MGARPSRVVVSCVSLLTAGAAPACSSGGTTTESLSSSGSTGQTTRSTSGTTGSTKATSGTASSAATSTTPTTSSIATSAPTTTAIATTATASSTSTKPVCNDLMPEAAAVDVSCNADGGSLPVMTGGTLEDGTYNLTGATVYTSLPGGCGGVQVGPIASTIVLGGGGTMVEVATTTKGTTTTSTSQVAVTGNMLGGTLICGTSHMTDTTYTATPTTITLESPEHGITLELVFTKAS